MEGTANIDFVLFRDRWMVAGNTFRPPWYHKNIMSELMGNIHRIHDDKPVGFIPDGMCLHNMMLLHGADKNIFEGASNAELEQAYLANTMSFMFETRFPQHLTKFAADEAPLQDNYIDAGLIWIRNSTAHPARNRGKRVAVEMAASSDRLQRAGAFCCRVGEGRSPPMGTIEVAR